MSFVSLIESLRDRLSTRPYVRPWALAVPVLVLLIALPQLRPLRHPGDVSVDEELRLASIAALVENPITNQSTLASRLAIDNQGVSHNPHVIIGLDGHLHSDQPPMLAFILSGPYWLMRRMGCSMQHAAVMAPYLLTVLGSTLPVAAAAGLVYRMSRMFEIGRIRRTAMAGVVVFGSGLFAYATVLNEHVPAAVLTLAAMGCFVHLLASLRPTHGGPWLLVAGLCAGLAGMIDWPAMLVLPLLIPVICAMRWRKRARLAGVLLYLLGSTPAIALHCALTIPITGNVLPGIMHLELAKFPDYRPPLIIDEDEDVVPWWQPILRGSGRPTAELFGRHGIFSHFPVMVFGVMGAFVALRRNWPATTKLMAAATLVLSLAVFSGYAAINPTPARAMFANRWFLLFLPLVLFWAGAWQRQKHRGSTWIIATILLVFSVAVTLIGATDPMPPEGYRYYTPMAVIRR